MFGTRRHRRDDSADEEQLALAAACPALSDHVELDVASLRALARCKGIDFATALLYDRLCRSPQHGRFVADVDRLVCERAWQQVFDDTEVIVVPGAFHAQRTETGADGQRVIEAARRLGCDTKLVDVASFGSPSTNANSIVRALAARRNGGRRVLVSLSKGSLDALYALNMSAADGLWRDVDCWISLSGLMTGSPLVGWLRRRPWRLLGVHLLLAWHRLPRHVLREIDRDTILGQASATPSLRGSGFDELRQCIATGLRVVHVVGFPLRRHLSCPLARRGHRRLAPLGPNDGGVLLADVCQLPGHVYPVWGADHYLQLPDADVGTIFAAVLANLLNMEAAKPVDHVPRDGARACIRGQT
jgi:hypothetical protein